MPFLSIIVPVYNKVNFLDNCINSILSQTFKDFELIIVNDGSFDGSTDKCNWFEKVDKRVKVIHQENKGVSAARNIGLKLAEGEFIGFVDSDDEVEEDMYQLLIEDVIRYKADISLCGVRKIFPKKIEVFYGTNKIKTFNQIEALTALLKKEIPRSIYDKIYRADIAKKTDFSGYIYEDTFYNFMAFSKAKKIIFNDTVKYNYIIRDNSISMTKFSFKYMDSIFFSRKIVDICKCKFQEIVPEAENFDFVTNISILNTIFISGKASYLQEYEIVLNNLQGYSGHLSGSIIKWKHRAAFYLFTASPFLYEYLMKSYCWLKDADLTRKK